MFELYIGDKNYSSWSMRPWLVLEYFQIAFQEHLIRFDDFKPDSHFKQSISRVSPTAKVPTLIHRLNKSSASADFNTDIVIWDSLAICEYLAEQYPAFHLWPKSPPHRAQARAICAEMHSGFQCLRSVCGMNIEAELGQILDNSFGMNMMHSGRMSPE